jgi:hypothetical protein
MGVLYIARRIGEMMARSPSEQVKDVLCSDARMPATEPCDTDVSIEMTVGKEVPTIRRVGNCQCLDMKLDARDPGKFGRRTKAFELQKLLVWF